MVLRHGGSSMLNRINAIMTKHHSSWTLFLICLSYFGLQLVTSYLGSVYESHPWSLQFLCKQLLYLDSSWYLHIASQGYVNAPHLSEAPSAVYAFFPLWPTFLALLNKVFFIDNIQLLGSFSASILFLLTLILMNKNKKRPNYLVPKTPLGLGFFVFSPGSWVFCTNHTESLFLFLSWICFYLSRQKQNINIFILTSVVAGFAALTRNQGVFLCIAVAFSLMQSNLVMRRAPKSSLKSQNSRREDVENRRLRLVNEMFLTKIKVRIGGIKRLLNTNKIVIFVLSGLISVSIYMLWPIYQWYLTGTPFASTATQENWHIVRSFSEYVENFFWISTSHLPRRMVFYGILIVALNLLKTRASNDLGLYLLLSVLVWPVQGNSFAQAYRFSSVLFPFWFIVGDSLSHRLQSHKKIKNVFGFLFFAAMFYWAYCNSQNYFSPRDNHWPY